MADACWLPDPTGGHELRYWDGTTWTEHISDQGITGMAPPSPDLPPPDAAPPPPSPSGAAFGAPQPPPAPAAAPQPDLVEQLRKLGDLRDAGILTEEEFAAQKAKLLG
jgi:hypothetical protein